MMFIFCYVRAANKTKALLSRYFLSNRFEITCVYVKTMTTTSESADEPAASKVFEDRKIRGQNIILVL